MVNKIPIRERNVERKLCKEVQKNGGLCLKFVSPGWSGAPDRIVLLPGGRIAFVEVKAPGEVPRPLQKRRQIQLQVRGFPVFILDDPEDVSSLLNQIGGEPDA